MAALLLLHGADFKPIHSYAAFCDRFKTDDALAHRGFSAAGFAHKAKRFTLIYEEINAVYRFNICTGLSKRFFLMG